MYKSQQMWKKRYDKNIFKAKREGTKDIKIIQVKIEFKNESDNQAGTKTNS